MAREHYPLVHCENAPGSDSYKAEVRDTIEEVVEHHLQLEYHNLGSSLNPQEFAKSRLPVHLDALKRGHARLLVRFDGGDSICFALGDAIQKKYFSYEGEIFWKIEPKLSDPFVLARFQQELTTRGESQYGKSDPRTDPFLVNQMLTEGFAIQSRQYSQFSEAVSLVQMTERDARHTVAYLPSVNEYFQQLRHAVRMIEARALRPEDSRFVYTRDYTAKNHQLLEEVPKIATVCQNILRLASLLADFETAPNLERRQVFAATLAVEFLTNPQSFAAPLDLAHPRTAVERVHQALQFMHRTLANTSEEEQKLKVGYIVYDILNYRDRALNRLFEQASVPADLGKEFIHRLLITTLPHLSEPYPGYGTADTAKVANPQLNYLYILAKPVLPPKASREASTLKSPRQTFKEALEKLSTATLLQYTPEQQAAFIRYVLTEETYTNLSRFPITVDRLNTLFGISFDPSNTLLTVRMKDKRLLPAATVYLRVCHERIEKDSTRLRTYVESIIISQYLNEFLKMHKLPRDQKKWFNYLQRLDSQYQLMVQRQDPKKLAELEIRGKPVTKEEIDAIREQIIQSAAAYTLWMMHKESYFEQCSLPETIADCTQVILLHTKLLTPQTSAVFQKQVHQAVKLLWQTFEQAYFGEGYQDRKQAVISTILFRSLEALKATELG